MSWTTQLLSQVHSAHSSDPPTSLTCGVYPGPAMITSLLRAQLPPHWLQFSGLVLPTSLCSTLQPQRSFYNVSQIMCVLYSEVHSGSLFPSRSKAKLACYPWMPCQTGPPALHQPHPSLSLSHHTGPLAGSHIGPSHFLPQGLYTVCPSISGGLFTEAPSARYLPFTHISTQMSLSHSPYLIPCQKCPSLQSPWPAPFLLIGSLAPH